MRIGVLTTAEITQLDWIQRLGFRCFEWVQFEKSPAGPAHPKWEPFVEELEAALEARQLRLSAIAAQYRNPLDPRQSEEARATFRRAIQVAARLGVKTVAGFAGAVIETEVNPRGGHVVYKPLENYLPQFLAFWEPLAQFAANHGVRLAFENCPQGPYHLPVMSYNFLAQPAMWERLFNATKWDNLGLEWDASHLICQFIDPVANLREFGSRVFHVHAKDAYIDRPLLENYGICHPGVAEHRIVGMGQADWPQIIHTLLRVGYDSDLNIEGWHDPVYRDHLAAASPSSASPLAGQRLEETGLLIAKRILEQHVPAEP
jgi:sugar phosphate isomerase/epimerase